MKTRMIILAGWVAMSLFGCQMEQPSSMTKTYDLTIDHKGNLTNTMQDNYLYVAVANISDRPVNFPDASIILEFTSYSGSIQKTFPVADHLIVAHPDWEQQKNYRLQSGEKLNLKIDLDKLIFGNFQNSASLPYDSYALNAYLVENRIEAIVPGVEKLRSNYVYIDIEANNSEMSIMD